MKKMLQRIHFVEKTNKNKKQHILGNILLWQHVHIDLVGPLEDKLFIGAGRKWPEKEIMRSAAAIKTIDRLGETLSLVYSPTQLVSDNGP